MQLRQYLLGGSTGVAGQVELKRGQTVAAAVKAGADMVVAETAEVGAVDVDIVATDVDTIAVIEPGIVAVAVVAIDAVAGKADECGG